MLFATPPRPPATAMTCLTPKGGATFAEGGGTLGGGEDGIVIGRGTYNAPPRNVELPSGFRPGAVCLFEHEVGYVSFPRRGGPRRLPDPFRDEGSHPDRCLHLEPNGPRK